ncbi:hypothetical protein ACFL1G_05340 [Planctomycetota bacterium]
MKPVSERRLLLPAVIVITLALLLFAGSRSDEPARVQAQFQAGANILVIPVQLGRDSYGLAMVDTDEQTLWIYEINNRGPAHSRLSLLAARSWRYDRWLEQYNTAEPKPEQVKLLLEKLGQSPDDKPTDETPGDNVVEKAGPGESDF